MSIIDENYNWKSESIECSKEIREMLKHIFKKYGDKFSLEDLHYLICNETNSIIMREVLEKRYKEYLKNRGDV